CVVCYKDFNLAKHLETNVPNLQATKLMQSFKSKKYVKDTFPWIHYYRYLTNDGIEFLRTYLNLPSDIVPTTLKKSAKPLGRPMGGLPSDRPRFITCVESLIATGAGLSVADSTEWKRDSTLRSFTDKRIWRIHSYFGTVALTSSTMKIDMMNSLLSFFLEKTCLEGAKESLQP
ncbi:40S ribosomal protein S10-1-like protein, partial [Tanacetum coccineum]